MKKILRFGILMVCTIVMTACAAKTGREEERSFKAEVLEINGDTIEVLAAEDEEVRRSSDRFRFSKKDLKDGDRIKVGDKIRVYFKGEIQEIYPASIKADRWQPIEENTAKEADSEKRMFMYQGKIYADTGETSHMGRCGVMDFKLDSYVKKGQLKKDLECNFGKNIDGQIGTREDRVEVLIDGQWTIFAYNENNLEGVSIEVGRNTNHSLDLKIKNNSEKEVQCRTDYLIEYYDKEQSAWLCVPYANDDVEFEDVVITLNKGETDYTYDWDYVYGKLGQGKYRVVKTFTCILEDGSSEKHYLLSEFEIK